MSAARKCTARTEVNAVNTNNQNNFSGGLNKGRRVCIVGGGKGGLTAALAFARSGARVEVHEQAPELTEVGAGVQITPNGARALEALGLRAALDDASIRAQAIEPMDALTGRAVTRIDLSHLSGPPYRFFHRADLIGILADACVAHGVTLHLGSKVETSAMSADVIVGAEGIHSATRTDLNAAEDLFFTGQVAWRAIIPFQNADPVARIWMAPRRHIVTYPLTGGRLNIVAVQERQQWAPEGWAHVDKPGNLRHAFRDVSGQLKGILAKVEDVSLWGLFRHPVARVWARENLCILGDAAHPTLPFLAQGANLAIEDAYILARCCSDAADVATGLARYQALRAPRVRRAIEAATSNAAKYHLSGPARSIAHTGLKTLGFIAPNAFLGRMDWLYDYDVTAPL